MKKTSLVVLKTTQPLFWEGEGFTPNQVYRCLTPIENESDSYLINAFWFTQAEFDLYFEFAHERVMRDWTELGFVKEGKPITFKEFKEYMDMHTYGKQTNNMRLGYVGIPRKNQYKFIPVGYDNKAIQLKNLYEKHYKETIEGNMIYLDAFKITLGCQGVSLSYKQ
jgi:hypothetical protein